MFLIWAVVGPVTVHADVVRVPADIARVEVALWVANPGDTVLVAPGTYEENILWPSTPGLKLLSEEGPETTSLDGGGEAAVISIESAVDTSTVIRGFTIRNGHTEGT